jgi:hypothetical protein
VLIILHPISKSGGGDCAKKKSRIFGRVNKKKQICFFFKPHPEIGKFFSNNHHHHKSCPAIKPDLTQKTVLWIWGCQH